MIESLCRQAPPRLHLVLASRSELPFPIERLRGQGQVLELAGAELAFDADETATLLASLAGAADAETRVRAPPRDRRVARRRAARRRGAPRGAAAERQATLDRIRRPGGPLLAYLAAEVFAHEPPEVEALVRTVAPLERFTPGSASRSGSRTPRRRCTRWRGEGSSSSSRATRSAGTRSAPRCASSRCPAGGPSAAEMRRVRTRAARWFEANDEPEEALRALTAAGDRAQARAAAGEPRADASRSRRDRRRARRRGAPPPLAPLARDRAARGRGAPGTRRLGRGAALLRPRGRGRRPSLRPGSPGAPASCTTSAGASTRRSRRTTSPRRTASRATSRSCSPGGRRRTGCAAQRTSVAGTRRARSRSRRRRAIRRRSPPRTPCSRCSPRSRAIEARTTRTTSGRSTTRSRRVTCSS